MAAVTDCKLISVAAADILVSGARRGARPLTRRSESQRRLTCAPPRRF
jgi:hypothetical protein